MTDGSLTTSQVPSAYYDPDLSSWRTSQESLFSEEPSLLERLPPSGTTADGQLYEHQTPALLIAVRAGSALLPTPAAWDSARGPDLARADRPNSGGPDLVTMATRLLPTPQAWDSNRGPDNSRLQGDGLRPSGQPGTLNLAGAIVRDLGLPASNLLPTPRAQNGERRNMKVWVRPLDQPQNLENVIGRLLPTPTARDYKDVGENTNYEKIAKNHILPGVIMTLPSDDGNPSPDEQSQPPLIMDN